MSEKKQTWEEFFDSIKDDCNVNFDMGVCDYCSSLIVIDKNGAQTEIDCKGAQRAHLEVVYVSMCPNIKEFWLCKSCMVNGNT